MFKRLGIASDHGGFSYKEKIKAFLSENYPEIEIFDLGTDGTESVDYPDFGHAMAGKIENSEIDGGILICGTGIGISIAANRHSAVRAALCTDPVMAALTRGHNDANILALGERIIGIEMAFSCVRAFLDTEFEGGRHARRIEKLG